MENIINQTPTPVSTSTEKQDIASKPIIFSKKVSLTDKYNFYEYLAVMLDG
jgi:hypothetical protein